MKVIRRMIAVVCLLSVVLLGMDSFAARAENVSDTVRYELVEVQRGTVNGTAKVNVRRKPDADADREGRLSPGESCVIVGETGDWWQVEFHGKTCYVKKGLLEVSTVMEEVAVIVEDPLEATLTGLETPTLLKYRNDYKIDGTIRSNIPLTKVSVEIYNLRTFKVDRSASVSMKREQNIREFDLGDIAGDISFRKVEQGEKRLIVRVESASDSAVLSDTFFYVYASGTDKYAEPTHMTKDCRIRVPRDDKYDLTDGSYTSGIELRSEEDWVTVTLPEDRTGEGLLVCWKTAPSNVRIEFFDGEDESLGLLEETNTGAMLHFYFDIDEEVRKVRIGTSDRGKMLCEIRVYEKDKVSQVVQQWEPLPEKVDILVVSAHQDDEMLFFGGTIPYYAAQGKTVGMVYMANCSRKRYSEALDGLWSCGLTYHPIFVGLADKNLDSYNETVKLWESVENTENILIELIRRYQPEVIVTHDVNGEYGHNQHKLTSAALRSAVTKSGDVAIHTESAEKYGTWTPKKLYIHLYAENALTMNVYDEPVEEWDGMTMTEIATIGYSKHCSQQNAFSMEEHGVRYDNRKYGLAFTTVGQDVEKNDFFENID